MSKYLQKNSSSVPLSEDASSFKAVMAVTPISEQGRDCISLSGLVRGVYIVVGVSISVVSNREDAKATIPEGA